MIAKLKKLNRIILSSNSMSNIDALKDLSELKYIDLSYNQLEDKDLEILKNHKYLETLDLRSNQIKNLPEWICDFPNMDIQWKDYSDEGFITFYGNPIEYPPIEVIKLGKKAIKKNFNTESQEFIITELEKQYLEELYNNFGYYAIWTPDTIIRIGDVGILISNKFIRETTLSNLGVSFNIISDETKHDLNYSSKGSVTITQKLHNETTDKANIISKNESDFIIEFNKKYAILLKSSNVNTIEIDDQDALKNEIFRLYKDGIWKKRWTVVTELKEAESTTIIISDSANGKIEIVAKNSLPDIYPSLTNQEIGLTVINSNGINTEFIAKKNLTPFFKLKGLKTSLFKGDSFGVK